MEDNAWCDHDESVTLCNLHAARTVFRELKQNKSDMKGYQREQSN